MDLDVLEANGVDPNEDIDALQPLLDENSTEDRQLKQLVHCNSMSKVKT